MYSVFLADSDPDLVASSPPLAEVSVQAIPIPAGEWFVEDARLTAERAPGGLLVLEGLLSREVRVGNRVAVELLGPTDTLRPWVQMAPGSLIGVESGWTVHQGAMLGLLTPSFMRMASEFPEVAAN
jgi:CRP/FNR family cyclic AMP-dependent transcriptional regulator